MSLISNLFGRIGYVKVERDRFGNFSYFLDDKNGESNKDYLKWSLEHPILFSILALRAKMVSQVEFKHIDAKGEEKQNSDVIKLLKTPNYFQSQQDFIFQMVYFMGSNGTNLVYTPTASKMLLPKTIYNLVPNRVDFKEVNKINTFIKDVADYKKFSQQKIEYKLDNKTIPIEIRNLIPMYDVANGLTENSWIKSPSRVKSIEKNLIIISELLKSKNINARMSQKYLATNKNSYNGAPSQVNPDDKDIIRRILTSKSLQVTNGDINVQHLVNNLKNLYLDSQISQEAQICLLAFGLNNDVLNYFSGGSSTFENQEKGEIRAYQNEIQGIGDNIANSFASQFGLTEKGEKIKASFEHLPIMQVVLKEKVDGFKAHQEAIKIALENGTIEPFRAKEMTEQYLNRVKL